MTSIREQFTAHIKDKYPNASAKPDPEQTVERWEFKDYEQYLKFYDRIILWWEERGYFERGLDTETGDGSWLQMDFRHKSAPAPKVIRKQLFQEPFEPTSIAKDPAMPPVLFWAMFVAIVSVIVVIIVSIRNGATLTSILSGAGLYSRLFSSANATGDPITTKLQ